MLELINDMPPAVVGVKATGKVGKEDYKNVLLPALAELYKRTGRVSLLLLIETRLKNYSVGAWMADASAGVAVFR